MVEERESGTHSLLMPNIIKITLYFQSLAAAACAKKSEGGYDNSCALGVCGILCHEQTPGSLSRPPQSLDGYRGKWSVKNF